MILIAQEGTQFQDIQYLKDQEYLAFDLEELTIKAIPDSSALKDFLKEEKARIHQLEIVGLELLQLPSLPSGYANILKKGKHSSKENEYLIKWDFDDSKLKIKVGIKDMLIPYMATCDRDIYGYYLGFKLGNRQLISRLRCPVKGELTKPLDTAALFITKVIDTETYELYTISIDVKGMSFTTIIAKSHQRVLFADLEARKFVDITELS